MSNPRRYEQYTYMYVHTYRYAHFYMYMNVCTKHQGLFSSSRGMDMSQFSQTRITLMVDILHNCYIILCMKKKYSQDTSTYRYLVIRRWAWEKNKKVVRFWGTQTLHGLMFFLFSTTALPVLDSVDNVALKRYLYLIGIG